MKKYNIILNFLLLLSVPFMGMAQTGECQEELIILVSPDDDLQETDANYQTTQEIEASNAIQGGSTVVMKSGEGILLMNGLTVNENATLLAKIEDCTADVCDVPLNIKATPLGGKIVKLEWVAVPEATKYKVRYRIQGSGNPWTEVNAPANVRFLDGLQPATKYEFNVKTVCTNLNAVWSALNAFTTPNNLCDIPSAGTVTTMANSATLTWAPIPSATKYKIKYKTVGNDWIEMTINAASVTLNNLTLNVVYKYKLKAKCPLGWTNWNAKDQFIILDQSFESEEPIARLNTDAQAINIFPNPVKDILTIELFGNDVERLSITSLDGKQIKEVQATSSTLQLDVKSLVEGMYFVHLTFTNGEVKTHKFVKTD